jgi:hypothetical protein
MTITHNRATALPRCRAGRLPTLLLTHVGVEQSCASADATPSLTSLSDGNDSPTKRVNVETPQGSVADRPPSKSPGRRGQ